MVGINKRIGGVSGFTLVEMLVTLAIIGLILSMLLPAFNAVRKMATEVRQKAQFSNIEMGLESFRSDFGDYPESGAPSGPTDSLETDYCGAQRLAEALVGRDGFGVHKDTQFLTDGAVLYNITAAGNKAARRGPYLELESANAVRPQAIFDSSVIAGTGSLADNEASLVLADMYGLVKNRIAGGKTGMPVLYYKADTSNVEHEKPVVAGMNTNYGYDTNIYSVTMNSKIFHRWAPKPNNYSKEGFWDSFYEATRNPNFGSGLTARPYRSESFILQSAGPDGFYGTGDDVFNFEPGK